MSEEKKFVASAEAKGKAKQLRLFAILLWVLGISAQIWAIMMLFNPPVVMWQIIALIVADLALVLVGSMLWKKSNKLDPPSEQNKLAFFMQSQLGLVTAIIAFLPLVVVILTNKDLDGKQKAILGSIAGVALLIAGIGSYDSDPASIEKYTAEINAQTDVIKQLNNGVNHVYWTEFGNKYHLEEDCQHIRNSENKFDGTVKEAWEARKIGDNELCKTCQRRAEQRLGSELQESGKELIEELIE